MAVGPTGSPTCLLGSNVAANPLHELSAVVLRTAAAIAAGGLTTTSGLAATCRLATASRLTNRLTATGRLAAAGWLTATGWLAALAMGPMVTKQTSLGNGSETQQQGGRKTAQVDRTTHGESLLDTKERETGESITRR